MVMIALHDESLRLDRLQRDILVPQLESFLAAAPDAEARAPYLALREALDTLSVPPQLAARLGAIAEVLLTSGRVRSLYGPGAELSLWSLFQKTPRGREVATSIEAANAAFKRLTGQAIESISAIARGPAAYALTIKTAEVQLVVRFEPAGLRLENIEVGGG
ncbi:MAG: hypothetical protein JOZ29_09555 [Deltaproteobacteria bacterium]|nr:hypothetical protein [Deltaproteobacteria bacterium]